MNPNKKHLRGRIRTDAFLAVGMAFNYADRSALPVVFPALRAEIGLSDVEFGLLGTMFLWTYALCGPLAGMLADRYSRTRIVLISLAAWSVVTLFTSLANSLLLLIAVRLALGVTESCYLPAAGAIIASNHDPETRGRAIGLLQISQSLGVIIGGVGVGYTAERFGWRSGFIILGVLGIVLALLGRRMVSERATSVSAASKSPRTRPRDAIAYLVRVPTYGVLLGGTICAGIAVWIFFNWLSLYFVERYGINMSQAGFAGMGTLQIASIAGIACGAWVSDRLVRRDFRHRMLVYAGGYLAAAPFLLIFLGTYSVLMVAVCCALFSFFRAFAAVNELPLLCEVVPAQFRSTAIGILLACATTAGGLGIFVGGILKGGPGLETVFAALGGFFALAAVGFLVAHSRWLSHDIQKAKAWGKSSELPTS